MFDFLRNKRVLITGHTGFKGSWLSAWLLKLGADVTGYALPPLTAEDHFVQLGLANRMRHIEGDLLDLPKLTATFRDARPEIVFHLAAQALVRRSYSEPKLTFDTNVTGGVNLLEAIRTTPEVRALVFVTSDKCYRNHEWVWGYRESDELGGDDPYSASKAAAELVFRSYAASFFSKRENFAAATSFHARPSIAISSTFGSTVIVAPFSQANSPAGTSTSISLFSAGEALSGAAWTGFSAMVQVSLLPS